MRVGDVIDGRYTLEELAGKGGMATVYRAREAESGALVGLKILRGMYCSTLEEQRFIREIRALFGLNHPGIVRYLAHGRTTHDEPYLVMEWLEGEDLDARLARTGRLSVSQSVRALRLAAEPLAAAHEGGVLHRDRKPHNLFLVAEPARMKRCCSHEAFPHSVPPPYCRLR